MNQKGYRFFVNYRFVHKHIFFSSLPVMKDNERRFISMLSDYGFKVTFGNEAKPAFTKKAVQALIDSPTPIKHVNFISNEAPGLTEESRSGLFDMACQDESGRVFIVEMQLRNFKHFIHRAKFYAFHKLNEFVMKGDYRFNNLPPIYVISILAGKTYKTKEYHQLGTLRNQHGEEIDNQITHVIVELGKFNLRQEEIKTDLEKLLYTMKTTEKTSVLEPFNPPEFWDEEWMKAAVEELNLRAMTPQERFAYQKALIKYRMAAQIAEDLEQEITEAKQKIVKAQEEKAKAQEEKAKAQEEKAKAQEEKAKAQEEIKQKEQEVILDKEEAIAKMLTSGLLTDEQIADFQNVPLHQVQKIKRTL